MMKNYKLHLPDGFKDTYGYEMLVKKHLENICISSFESFGYELIKTPGVEYADIYSTNGQIKNDLYNLINREGEVLALSNDFTLSIARFISSNKSLNSSSFKYCYSGNIYRYPRSYQGKNHEFLQAGVELIGESGINSDISIIYLACKTLEKCNIKNYSINLGSSKFLNTLLDDYKINEEVKELIYQAIDNQDYVTLGHILNENTEAETADVILDLIMHGGRIKFIDKLINRFKNTKCESELLYLKNIYLNLKELGVDNIIFDFSVFTYQKYYTGILFSFYIDNVTKDVISGGRCDNLYKDFNKKYPNIGFGIDLDVLTLYALNNNLVSLHNEKYLSYYDKDSFINATKSNDILREKGIIVNQLDFKSYDDALKYAKENNYKKIIVYENNKSIIKEVA